MVLYNLPSVIKAEEIVVVAGEKDCLNVTKKTGMVATTNVGGEARKWEEENTQYFKDKDVYIHNNSSSHCNNPNKEGYYGNKH